MVRMTLLKELFAPWINAGPKFRFLKGFPGVNFGPIFSINFCFFKNLILPNNWISTLHTYDKIS